MAQESQKQLADRLKGVPLFSTANAKQRATLAKLGRVLEWSEGTAGVKEGSTGAAFFLILDGSVDVSRGGRNVARLRDGDFFGEMALLGGGKRNATVTANVDTRLFTLGRPAFKGVVKTQPDIAMCVLEAMAARQQADL